MSKILNEDTLVPIGVAIAVIGTVTAWIVDTKNGLASHTEIIESLNRANEDQVKLIHEINSRLSRIEWKLEFDNTKQRRKND